MKSEKAKGGSDIRLVMSAMIRDVTVCSRVSSQWNGGLFADKHSNLIGHWCIKHLKQYGEAPGDKIYDLFDAWAETTVVDEAAVQSVEHLLNDILRERRPSEASDYYLDIAGKLFNKVRLEKEMEQAEIEIERGLVDEAMSRLTQVGAVNLGEGSYADLSADYSVWMSAFERERVRPLVAYPGALGVFVGDSFTRGTLYAFMGVDKVGKSRWLIDLAYRAARKRRRVAFFDTGDSIQEEVVVRFACRAAARPEFDEDLKIPVDWDGDRPRFESVRLEAVDAAEGYKSFRKICRVDDYFRLSCHENSSINVEGIDSILSDWDRLDWRPDVIVIDYADILAPPSGIKETVDQIGGTWKSLRRMSQRRRALVVTATQVKATAYKDKGILSRKHFAGSKEKLAHVNGLFGINVSPFDKDMGMTRLNWVVRRRGRFSETGYVTTAGAAAIENPAMISTFMKRGSDVQ